MVHRATARRRPPRPSRLLLRLVARLGAWMRAWWRARAWAWPRPARRRAPRARLHFESFEPRVLLSADLAPAVAVPEPSTTPAEQRHIDADGTAPVTIRWHANGSGGGVAAISTTGIHEDADGTLAEIQVSGPGSAGWHVSDGQLHLLIDGSTRDTRVSLTTSGGDGRIEIHAIHATSELGAAALGQADLAGPAQFDAGVGSLVLGALHGASVQIGGTGQAQLSLGAVNDSQLLASRASVALQVDHWHSSAAGASRVDVAQLRSLHSGGDLQLDLHVNGVGHAGYMLGLVQAGGGIGQGHWSVEGRANRITANHTDADWRLNVDGTLAVLQTAADASGQVSVAGLQMLLVGGAARGLTLLVGADLGDDVAIGGTGGDADSFRPGTLARARISGDINDSHILVGIDPVNGSWLDGDDTPLGTAAQRVQELLVGGQLLGTTRIVAPAFPALVRVGGALVDPGTLDALSTGPVDTVAPVLSARLAHDSGVSASDGLTNDPSITGQVSDNGGVTQLWAAIDPAQPDAPLLDVSHALLAGGALLLDRATLDTLAGGTLADGAHTVRLVAQDAHGNRSQAVDVGFVLDTQAPAAGFAIAGADALPGSDTRTAAAIVQLSGHGSAGATVTLAAQGLSTLVGANDLFQLAGVRLQEGDNTLALRLADPAGNDTVVTRTLTREAQAQSDAVLQWNRIALQAVQQHASDPPVATRLLAMVGLAQFDALAAIDGAPAYLVARTVGGPASAPAAAAVAAHRILSLAYPARQAVFDAELAASLDAVADGAAKDTGIALGLAIADAVWALRANDGAQLPQTYTGSTAPGQWRPTGPMYEVADQPHWRSVQPFALATPHDLRPGPPPALDTAAYAQAVEQVKRLGSATSTERSADQTEQALFWADGKGSYTPPGHWNAIAIDVAQAQGNSLSANARLFAQLNVALADAAIACWDAKYSYGLWRPETAIQGADLDDNAGTTRDAAWRPLLLSPSHPEYVSGHSTFSMAAATVLAATFGDDTAFSTTSPTLPGVTRSYTSFSQAAREAGDSRIYGGIHYAFSNLAGQQLGAQVAQVVLARFLQAQDSQAPVVVLADTPAASRGNLTLTGQVLDNLSGVAWARISVDGAAPQELALGADGSFQFTTTLATDGSADGLHTLQLSTQDAAGNLGAGTTRSFVLDTRAPTIALPQLADGAVIDAGTRLAGSVDGTGSAITSLRYRLGDNPEQVLPFQPQTGAFDAPLALGNLPAGEHVLRIDARDAAGHTHALTRTVTLASLPALTITRASPAASATGVGVTQRPQVFFSRAVDTSSLTADSFYALGADGQKLAATIVPAQDGSFAWLFLAAPMPGGASITVHVDGARVRAAADGALLDADGDGQPGGLFTLRFTTVASDPGTTTTVIDAQGQARVTRTSLVGAVVDPGPDLQPMTFDDIGRGPDGIIHTGDDVLLLPIANARVWILGQEDRAVFTDAQGRFELTDVPAGKVKLAIDGRTATNPPTGVFFPEMVMDLALEAGQVNTVMGSMGSADEQRANEDRVEVYLPRVAASTLQSVDPVGPTQVVPPTASAPDLTPEQRQQIQLTVPAGAMVDEHGQPVADAQIGIATVPPEMILAMLPEGTRDVPLTFTIQAPGVAAFTTPLELTLPNVYGAQPGEQLYFYSFDHASGLMVIEGTATVSDDGSTVTTDPGQGITKPGWHGFLANLARGLYKALLHDNPCFDAGLTALSTVIGALAVTTAAGPATVLAGVLTAASVINDVVDFSDFLTGAIGPEDVNVKSTTGKVVQVSKYYTDTIIARQPDPDDLFKQFVDSQPRITPGNPEVRQQVADARAAYNKQVTKINDLRGLSPLLGFAAKGFGFAGFLADARACLDRMTGGGNVSAATTDMFANLELLLDRMEAASAPLDQAINRMLGERIVAQLRPDQAVWTMALSEAGIEIFDANGLPTSRADGSPARFSYEEVLDPRLFADADYRQQTAALLASAHDILFGPGGNPDEFLHLGALASAEIDAFSRSVMTTGTGSATPANGFHYAITDTQTGDIVLRGVSDTGSVADLNLAINREFVVEVYDPVSQRYGFSVFTTDNPSRTWGDSFRGSNLPGVPLGVDTGVDSDGDGMSDRGERVVGTLVGNPDSDGDGVTDRAELLGGTDPLGGRALSSGVVASLALRGDAKALVLTGATDTGTGQRAYVATGARGLAIVDVSQWRTPLLVSEFALAGDAQDVGIDEALALAVVAAGTGGLHVVDVSNPAAPRLLHTVAINASQVEVFEGTAYVAMGSVLRAYDLLTGERLGETLSPSPIKSLARDGQMLYAIDGRQTLRSWQIDSGQMLARGTLSIGASAASLSVGGGLATVGMGSQNRQGFVTVDIRDPDDLRLISGVDDLTITSGALAATGSGLLVSGGQIIAAGGRVNAIDISSLADTGNTGNRQTRFVLPQAPRAIAISAGIAFVAAGSAGLQVVNYLAADNLGVAPTIGFDPLSLDIDPATDGIQVLEGETITLRPVVSDDVQVRNVELLLDGQVVHNDTGFPFELAATLPTLAANGGASTVTLQLRATDTGGNSGTTPPYTITLVPDTQAPTLVLSSVTEGATRSRSLRTINLVFSEALAQSTVHAGTIRLVGPDGQDVPPENIQFRQLGREVQLTYGPLALIGAYELRLDASALTDRAGNPLGAAATVIGFTLQTYSTEWIGPSGGFWDVAANWSTGVVPGADDDVYVGLPAGGSITVRNGNWSVATLTSDTSVVLGGGSLAVDGEALLRAGLRIDGGSVTLRGDSIVSGGLQLFGGTFTADAGLDVDRLQLAGGTLTGTGNVQVATASQWTGGVINGSGRLSFLGDLAIDGPQNKYLLGGRIVDTLGTTTWRGATASNTNDFYTGPATINNAGTWIDDNAFDTIVRDWYAGAPAVFNNDGSYIKRGSSTSTVEMQFDNRGTLDVQGGALRLGSGGAAGATGVLNIDAGATLRLQGGDFALDGTTITGTGRFEVSGTYYTSTSVVHTGETTFAGELALTGGTLFADGRFSAARYTQSDADSHLDGSGAVIIGGAATWSDGNLEGSGSIDFLGDLAITGAGDKAIRGGRVVNTHGTTTWSGATAANTNDFYTGPSTINNLGTWIDNNAFDTIVRDWDNGPALVFNNAGSYRKLGTSTSTLQLTFHNTGSLEVQGGVLGLARGGSAGSTGSLDIDPGATLRLQGGDFALDDTTITGTGRFEVSGTFNTTTSVVHAGDTTFAGELALTGGTLFANGTFSAARYTQSASYAFLEGTGAVTISGAATWSDGNLEGSGSIDFLGDLAITGAGDKAIRGGRVVNTHGTTTWSGATAANTNDFYTGPSTINNTGTWIDNNAFDTIVRDWDNGPALVFNNAGTYRKLGTSTSTLQVTFHNTGLVDVQAGVLGLARGGSAGSTGSLDIDPGATLRLQGGDFALDDTTITGTGRFEVSGTFNTTTSVVHAGDTTFAGELALTGGTLFANGTFSAARYTQSASYAFLEGTGAVTISGAATWSDGNLEGSGSIDFLGDLAITGAGDKAIRGGRVVNTHGTTTWSGATAANTNDFYTGPSTINNTGTWIDNNAFNTLVRDWDSGPALVFNNAGTYRKLGASTSTLQLTFNNSGALEVQGGRLVLVRGGTSTGAASIAVGAELALEGGDHAWNTGATASVLGTLAVQGSGTLLVHDALSLQKILLGNGGTLAGAGRVTLTGTGSQWTGGTMAGGGTTTVAAGADMTISGNSRKYLGERTIDNQGSLVDASTGDRVEIDGAATLTNSGLVDLRGNTAWGHYTGTAGMLTLANSGTLRRSTGTGQFDMQDTVLDNTGLVQVSTGTLALAGAGGDAGTSDGDFSIAAGAELAFLAGTQTWLDGANAAGAGVLALRNISSSVGGTLAIEGTTVTVERIRLGPLGGLSGPGLLTITGTGSSWTAGTMSGGGTTRIAAGADLTISGNSRKYLGERTIDNQGSLVDAATGDRVELDGAATLRNSGLFEIRGAASWGHYTGAVGSLTIDNSGTVRKQSDAGQFELRGTVLNNTGLVDIVAGTLAIAGAGNNSGTSSGTFAIAAGGELAFLAGTQTWVDGAEATGEGMVALRNLSSATGGTLAVTGSTVTVQRIHLGTLGSLTGDGVLGILGTGSLWSAGTMSGGGTTRIAAGADFTVTGTQRKYLGARTIDNQGLLVEASSGDRVEFDGTATLLNAGVFDIRSNGSWGTFTGIAGTLAFTNTGTLRKSLGLGDFAFTQTTFTNTGLVEVLVGRILVNGTAL